MRAFSNLVLFALPVLGAFIPYQVAIAPSNELLHATWEKDDRSRIVPLAPDARNGSVDPVIEEGLISQVGPRFANVFYEDANSLTSGVKCFLKCPSTVVKVAPCIWGVVHGGKIEDLLKCVSKQDLCNCADCLPPPVNVAVQALCGNSAIVDIAAEDRFSPYVDYAALSGNSLSLAAFRGDLYKFQVEQLKTINQAGQSPTRKTDDGPVHAMCVIGSGCGGCSCCVGGCIDDTCIGICA